MFCHLVEPRLSYDKKKMEFEANLVFDPGDAKFAEFQQMMMDFAQEYLKTAEIPDKVDLDNLRIRLPIRDHTDRDKVPTGEKSLRVKGNSEYAPRPTPDNPDPKPIIRRLEFFDATGRTKIQDPVEPGNGSRLRIGVDMVANIFPPQDPEDPSKLYVSLYPRIVQVVELVESRVTPEAYGIGEVDTEDAFIANMLDADEGADMDPSAGASPRF
ncbi:MAG TPA: hypothetical protein VJ997_06440 [Longimicrobiales bacterium]|nr:hypothetical protein [Longimicrobiales bacterium]